MRQTWPLGLIIGLSWFLTGCGESSKPIKPASTIGGQYPLKQFALQEVSLTGGFWGYWHDRLEERTIPHLFGQLDSQGHLENFRLAAQAAQAGFRGKPYSDSDVYKVIEAVSLGLIQRPNVQVEARLDSLIELIAHAQAPNGYLHTFTMLAPEREPFTNPLNAHELYNLGHLVEAGIAYAAATGKRTLLEVGIRYVELVEKSWPEDQFPGHPELEQALLKLYEVEQEVRYLRLAERFIQLRAPHSELSETKNRYYAAHKPLIEQDSAVGHAVRALYLYAAATELAVRTSDTVLFPLMISLWEDLTNHKLSLTGGVGIGRYEALGKPYQLDPEQVYNETCAAVALMRWSHQLFLATGAARYMDIVERILYNGLLSGMSLKGDAFFYVNPLASDGKTAFNREAGASRAAWFETACCPPNVARTLLSLPTYTYALRQDTLYTALFINTRLHTKVEGQPLVVAQQTTYPWEGTTNLVMEEVPTDSMTLAIRIPIWAQNRPIYGDLYRYLARTNQKLVLNLNGRWVYPEWHKGFACITRRWEAGDSLKLVLPMSPRRVVAHPGAVSLAQKQAIERGPIVYAAEGKDQQKPLDAMQLPTEGPFWVQVDTMLEHRFYGLNGKGNMTESPIQLIPYYIWNNRGPDAMQVWWPVETTQN